MDKLLKVTVITWAAFLILLAGMLLTTQAAEPETFAAPVKVDRPEPSAVVGEDPDEDALITAALEDQGYFRADAPLDYELQKGLPPLCAEGFSLYKETVTWLYGACRLWEVIIWNML